MTFPWLKKIEDMEKTLDKKTELQQQEIDVVKSSFENLHQECQTLRRECEGIRRGFVELIGHTTKMMNQIQAQAQAQATQSTSNSVGPIDLDEQDNAVDDLRQENEKLKDENRFLQEKIEAQQDIIHKLNEELESSENKE